MPIQLTPYDQSIAFVIANEGMSYTAAPHDRGLCSRYGITLASLRAWHGKQVTCEDVAALTLDDAHTFYKLRYWDALQLGSIGSNQVATAFFDMAVLTGSRTATRIMQQCCGVAPDYILGPVTLRAINSQAGNDLLVRFGQAMQRYFIDLVRADASQAKWLFGWLCRTSKLMMLAF